MAIKPINFHFSEKTLALLMTFTIKKTTAGEGRKTLFVLRARSTIRVVCTLVAEEELKVQ